MARRSNFPRLYLNEKTARALTAHPTRCAPCPLHRRGRLNYALLMARLSSFRRRLLVVDLLTLLTHPKEVPTPTVARPAARVAALIVITRLGLLTRELKELAPSGKWPSCKVAQALVSGRAAPRMTVAGIEG